MSILEIGNSKRNGTGGSLSLTHGLSISEGDVVVAYIHLNNSSTVTDNNGANSFTKDAEFDFGGTGYSMAVFTRVAGSSEPPNYAFSYTTSSRWAIVIRVFSGVDTANLWGVVPNAVTGSGATITSSNVSSLSDNSLALFAVGVDRSGNTTYSNVSNGFGSEFTENSTQSISTYTKAVDSGSVGATEVTSSAASSWFASLGVLSPASGGSGGGNTGPSIDNIDGDNEVIAGQQNVVITGTNIENATSATLGGEALTIV